MKKFELVGQKFERLKVILKLENDKRDNTQWLCVCDCGQTTKASGTDLKTGRKPSCGCRKSELISEAKKLPIGEAGLNSLYAQYRKGARERDLEFLLKPEEFRLLIDKTCHYCGVGPMLKIFGTNRMLRDNTNGNFLYTGIYRKDSDIGYLIDNCVTCCKTCNFAKNDMSYEEFLLYLDRVVKFRT